ncbi:amidase [Bryobacter aggregatus]|uniref:amidase n=1 Tax=Bryobacter aggregatus TaxID=360054 RepID=UPI0004E17CD4|nr:amidase [Bryobacter aggregatus]
MAIAGVDLFFASATELNAGWRKGDYSSEELTRAYLDRLEGIGGEHNALALSLRRDAIRRAKDVDKDRKIERFRGKLQGVPFGAKDLLAWPKHPTTWGAKPYADQVFDKPATVLTNLDKMGAVLIGKLAMIELAGGPGYRWAKASLTGPCLNPWDKTRWAGGSSSGSGAAVAAGLVSFALGSETSGSILTPAAFCGITGLRPTYGLVSRAGAMALSWTLDKIGPMARTAEDCGVILDVIAGGDDDDPMSAGKGFAYTPQFARPFADYTIGYAPVDWEEWADPEARSAFAETLRVFRAMGFQLKEAELPDFPYGAILSTILQAEQASIFEELVTSGKVEQLADEKQIAGLKAAGELLAKDYLRAMRIRRQVIEAFKDFFYNIDMILVPTRRGIANEVAVPLDAPGSPVPAGRKRGFNAHTPAGNLAGLPALTLPCGLVKGLPVGVTLMGRAFTENALLAVGQEFQKRTDWHKRRPALAERMQ